MHRNNLVESIFQFSDGSNWRGFAIGNEGGIVAVNASQVFPEIELLNEQYIIYHDYIIYNSAAAASNYYLLRYSTTLDFDISLLLVGINPVESVQHLFATATITILSPPGKIINMIQLV